MEEDVGKEFSWSRPPEVNRRLIGDVDIVRAGSFGCCTLRSCWIKYCKFVIYQKGNNYYKFEIDYIKNSSGESSN